MCLATQVRCTDALCGHVTIHKYGLSCRIETTAIDAYIDDFKVGQQ